MSSFLRRRTCGALVVFMALALPTFSNRPVALLAEPLSWSAPRLVRHAAGSVSDLSGGPEALAPRGNTTQGPDSTLAVPWNGTVWQSMPNFTWAACDVRSGTRQAIDIAIGQWRYAARNQGLPIQLTEVPCHNGDTTAQIALIETTADQAPGPTSHEVFGLGVSFDARDRICGVQAPTPCSAANSLVELYTDNWVRNSLSFEQAAKTIAHEIGHTVGLGHAPFCNFDSLMAQNCEPILRGLGPDDIQSVDALIDFDRSYFGQPPLGAQPAATSTAGGASVTYHRGWNLVAGPRGTLFTGASGPLFTLLPGDDGYRSWPSSQASAGSFGYWAYFNSDVTVRLNGGGAPFYSGLTTPGQYFLIGNDGGNGAMHVLGADAIYTWDTQNNRYVRTDTIQPGQAAWVLPSRDGEIAVYLTSLSRGQVNCYLNLGNPSSC